VDGVEGELEMLDVSSAGFQLSLVFGVLKRSPSQTSERQCLETWMSGKGYSPKFEPSEHPQRSTFNPLSSGFGDRAYRLSRLGRTRLAQTGDLGLQAKDLLLLEDQSLNKPVCAWSLHSGKRMLAIPRKAEP
jgi:hypothetical protein